MLIPTHTHTHIHNVVSRHISPSSGFQLEKSYRNFKLISHKCMHVRRAQIDSMNERRSDEPFESDRLLFLRWMESTASLKHSNIDPLPSPRNAYQRGPRTPHICSPDHVTHQVLFLSFANDEILLCDVMAWHEWSYYYYLIFWTWIWRLSQRIVFYINKTNFFRNIYLESQRSRRTHLCLEWITRNVV